MWKLFCELTQRKKSFRTYPVAIPRVVLTEGSLIAIQSCMGPEIRSHREGIAYLLGKADVDQTLILSAVRPDAQTTSGSFAVTAAAMATVVRCAAEAGLHVVGQAHTHPRRAFHSHGDDVGARIAYDGYVSLVFPDYGEYLPQLDGLAAYVFESRRGFVKVSQTGLRVVPSRMQ